jgi:hypothetical protein
MIACCACVAVEGRTEACAKAAQPLVFDRIPGDFRREPGQPQRGIREKLPLDNSPKLRFYPPH